MSAKFTDAQLRAFLEEALPSEQMTQIESSMRADRDLCERLNRLNGERNAGVHSLGDMWRRHRLTCPTRQQLGNYLLGTLDDEWTNYVTFHIEQVGCRVCAANVADLKLELENSQRQADPSVHQKRRHKYFQSSAGYLRKP